MSDENLIGIARMQAWARAARMSQTLASLLDTLATASQWQPIETAPKDGTHILLANKAGTSEGGWLTDLDHGAEWEGQLGMAGWWRTDGTDWPNTHWMPMPANPSETPNSSPAVGTIKQIDTPPGRPDLHEWTGHEWVPVGYSMARVGSAVGAALLDAEQRK